MPAHEPSLSRATTLLFKGCINTQTGGGAGLGNGVGLGSGVGLGDGVGTGDITRFGNDVYATVVVWLSYCTITRWLTKDGRVAVIDPIRYLIVVPSRKFTLM